MRSDGDHEAAVTLDATTRIGVCRELLSFHCGVAETFAMPRFGNGQHGPPWNSGGPWGAADHH
jgi:hypothetical protein